MKNSVIRKAIMLAKLGQRKQARRIIIVALRSKPDDGEAWIVLAQLVDDHDEAIYCMQQGIKLRPEDTHARSWLERMKRGQKVMMRAPSLTLMTAEREPDFRESFSRKFHGLNLPLAIGLLLVGLLLAIALTGEWIAPQDPLETHFILKDRSGEFVTPPFAPGQIEGFLLGSDFDGRDVFSRLLIGVRPTLVLVIMVAAARLFAGTFFGVAEGWFEGLSGALIGSVTKIALSIPMLIIAIMVIYLFGLQTQAGVFVIALSLTGWGQAAHVIADRVRIVKRETYIEASRALGAGSFRILWKHVIPQIRTLLIVTLSFEMSAVLLQMAELGFLGYFMGGGAIRLVPDGKSPAFIPVRIAGPPELGQMLAGGWSNFIYTPLLPVMVGTVFFLAVFSFMMLGEGLKRYYSETSSPGPMSALRFALWRRSEERERKSMASRDVQPFAQF
jgi:ABC-type dipeptide/oligopeptide/nickel transport system permease subunit